MITILLKKIIGELITLKANIKKAKSSGQKANYVTIKTVEYTSTNF